MSKITEILSVGGSKGLVINGMQVKEYIKEQVVIAIAEHFKQPEPKWDDNIPEYGVLCWVQHNPEGKKKVVTIYSRKNRDDYETALYWIDSRTIVTPLTNEEIEEFKR